MGILEFFLGKPSPQKFAQAFINELKRAGEKRELKFDEQEFRILRGSGEHTDIIFLQNFFDENLSLPLAKRREHLKSVVQVCMYQPGVIELSSDYDEAKEHLRPKLWVRAALTKVSLRAQIDSGKLEEKFDIPDYEIGSHLVASVAYDLPTAIRSVSNDELAKWGVSNYEAIETARANLEQVPFQVAQMGDGTYLFMNGDNYDSARLLLPEVIRSLQVQGDVIAMVPQRDCLIVTGADDVAGLQAMVDITEKAMEDPRPMVPVAVQLVGDDWVDWLPPVEHPLYSRFKRLELGFLASEYAEQKQMLDQWHERKQLDRFAASFQVIEKKDSGQLLSYAVWSAGVVTLLPKADHVIFYQAGKAMVASASWDRVQEVVGNLMTDTNFYPPRFFVQSFPNAAELAALGNDPL